MKQIFVKTIFLTFMIILLNCSHGVSETISNDKIKDAVIKFGRYSLIIKFSNLIYEGGGKEVKIPIFRGNMGDITYRELRKYCSDNKLLKEGYRETGFIIVTKEGEVKKTFHEFLRFYQNNLFKDIGIDVNKPSEISGANSGVIEIYYDFKIKDIPFVIKIQLFIIEEYANTSEIKSVFDIDGLDETKGEFLPPYFKFEIY